MFKLLLLGSLGNSPEAVPAALDLTLRRKALGAEALVAQRDAVLGGRYPALKSQLDNLRKLRAQIAQKALKGPATHEIPDVHRSQLLLMEGIREMLEADLARQLPEIRLEYQLRTADLRAVAMALPKHNTLVEFIKFRRDDCQAMLMRGANRWQEYRYLAFVVPAGALEAVRMIDLGEAAVIDERIATYRTWVARDAKNRALELDDSPAQAATDSPGETLRVAVFDPLKNFLNGKRHLILAPDGELTRVPFEALPLGDVGHYLADEYSICYINTGRDLLRGRKATGRVPAPSLIIADPDFNLSEVLPEAVITQEAGRRKEWRFERLPGARLEGELLAQLLEAPLWQGMEALERHVKQVASPRVLHIATHGFFLENQSRDTDLWRNEFAHRLSSLENPLLRSGLALAGANHAFTPGVLPEEAEDGLLTAEDVSGLDLLDTELVVLSACETGLGEAVMGEGVFGLRRAFILAGAKTLIMSLWKVADLATTLLMERLYSYLVHDHLPRDEALRKAQTYLRRVTVGELRNRWLNREVIARFTRNDPKARAEFALYASQPDSYCLFDHPYYWGAFVLLGETAPLAYQVEPTRLPRTIPLE